jgi:hypothetical protein
MPCGNWLDSFLNRPRCLRDRNSALRTRSAFRERLDIDPYPAPGLPSGPGNTERFPARGSSRFPRGCFQETMDSDPKC